VPQSSEETELTESIESGSAGRVVLEVVGEELPLVEPLVDDEDVPDDELELELLELELELLEGSSGEPGEAWLDGVWPSGITSTTSGETSTGPS
jgi:hypothetical protein